ncbi:MAG: hypothetical protein AB1782_16450 [Cyanobacteriota bacterium]
MHVSPSNNVSFKGKLFVYSTAGDKVKLVKTMPTPRYVDEKGFNGDERRVNSFINALSNPRANVKPVGKFDVNNCSCILEVNNEKVIVQGNKKGNRIISFVLKDEPRKQMLKWILNPDKDIRLEISKNLYQSLQNFLSNIQNKQ